MDVLLKWRSSAHQSRALGEVVSYDWKHIIYGVSVLAALTWFVTAKVLFPIKAGKLKQRLFDPETPASKRPNASKPLKAPARPYGIWPPSDFKRPAPKPLLKWDVHQTRPQPYRPFRWGPYHITMGLRTMHWDDWIELDNHYLKFHEAKKRRIEERPHKYCRTAPEALEGAIELLEEL